MSFKVETFTIELTEEQKEEMKEFQNLFCSCEEQTETPKYVEGHLGVNHGWICEKCEKFVQIG